MRGKKSWVLTWAPWSSPSRPLWSWNFQGAGTEWTWFYPWGSLDAALGNDSPGNLIVWNDFVLDAIPGIAHLCVTQTEKIIHMLWCDAHRPSGRNRSSGKINLPFFPFLSRRYVMIRSHSLLSRLVLTFDASGHSPVPVLGDSGQITVLSAGPCCFASTEVAFRPSPGKTLVLLLDLLMRLVSFEGTRFLLAFVLKILKNTWYLTKSFSFRSSSLPTSLLSTIFVRI